MCTKYFCIITSVELLLKSNDGILQLKRILFPKKVGKALSKFVFSPKGHCS